MILAKTQPIISLKEGYRESDLYVFHAVVFLKPGANQWSMFL